MFLIKAFALILGLIICTKTKAVGSWALYTNLIMILVFLECILWSKFHRTYLKHINETLGKSYCIHLSVFSEEMDFGIDTTVEAGLQRLNGGWNAIKQSLDTEAIHVGETIAKRMVTQYQHISQSSEVQGRPLESF